MIRILYDDYNITDKDIAYFYNIDITDVDDAYRENYNSDIWEDFLIFLREQPQSLYVAQGTRHTHYPEYYKNATIGYQKYKTLIDLITSLAQDYNVVKYDTTKHTLTMHTSGHDNNYSIVIKEITPNGKKYFDNHKLDYQTLEHLFDKYSKGVVLPKDL